MNWIVIWMVSLIVQAECPDYKPDKYTGEYPMSHCLVYHTKTVDKNMEERFDTKEEAQAFIDNAPEEIKKTMTLKKEI